MFRLTIFISVFLFLISCQSINFTYKENTNLINPIYNKTLVRFSGIEIPAIYGYSTRYFRNNIDGSYELIINIEEKKDKRAVQTNQAISKLDYEIRFNYALSDVVKKCVVYTETITSRFSYEPKSSGYNFGSDQSLKKLYELSSKNNLQQFISNIQNNDITNCK